MSAPYKIIDCDRGTFLTGVKSLGDVKNHLKAAHHVTDYEVHNREGECILWFNNKVGSGGELQDI
jgi:hypothetical protein